MENFEDLETIDNFNWYYKNLFIWNQRHYSRGKRVVFFGDKIEEPKFTVVLKKIKIDENYYDEILKEIYFLACTKNNNFFIKLVDFFLSEDQKYIFLILKDEGVSLVELIDYTVNNNEGFDYTKIDDMIKWIIFQIVCGLFILHKSNLIHHDIKPGNILISSLGKVKIGDFGSVDRNKTKGHGTLFYESPNVILKKKATEKDDMWAVGVIMIELYRKNYPFFNYCNFFSLNNDNKREKICQLKSIFSKYKLTMNNEIININDIKHFNFLTNTIIEQKAFEPNKFGEELNKIDEIKDKDAFDLISNLLKINPKKRFSAEQALKSKYLSKYIDEFKNLGELTYKKSDYENLFTNSKNKKIFIKNIEIIKQKYFGEVIFE